MHDRIQDHKWLPAALVLLCLFFFGVGFLTWSVYSIIVFFALMLAGWYFKSADAFLVSLTCASITFFCKIAVIHILWPLPIIMALVLVFAAGRLLKFTRGGFDWIRKGDLGPRQIAAIAIISALSGMVLFGWYMIVKPNISDLTGVVPHATPVVLIATGLVFAFGNAACEEFVWRGIIFNALERTIRPGAWVLCIQALSFGVAHAHGFPRGASGIVLAGIYGYVLGLVRQDAKGLLAPIAAHFLADAVIYSILASAVRATGAIVASP